MEIKVDRVLSTLTGVLYPPVCVLCAAPGEGDRDLCAACRLALPVNRHACWRCALPLPAASPAGAVCGACSRRPPVFDHCFAPYLYHGAMRYLLTGLKFNARTHHARLLGELFFAALEGAALDLPEALVPVPLHVRRLRERGFNQALEIARRPAQGLGLPLLTDLCSRQRPTRAHSALNARARRKDIRGAFELHDRPDYRHLALVDDVVTTGSTVAELARLLKRAGVSRVDVWALARTP